jgi:hypothetical protein
MGWIRIILREFFGLFVDDGSFAIAILAWLGVVWLLFPRIGLLPPWLGPILFAGLGLILIENSLRYARRSGRARTGKFRRGS